MATTTPIQTSPVVTIADGHVVTTSIAVAEYFQKPHKDVLAKIARLECSAEFTERNFSPSEYTDSTGRQLSPATRSPETASHSWQWVSLANVQRGSKKRISASLTTWKQRCTGHRKH
ncbi:Phage regulatory protein Rha (Phage_pRha) [Sodalis glossinidius str. 'morsitans']|uniref:Phage regulatory protein Rha (Phage_pRha) n=1 Tax=Sodalis glossinidius (strain morsitans) TaxID=343509 RepID=A0A193QLR2_SODGM|nr:Phage regulatory protein Rha (Phage_pRha) [Sodalis glossinidius str. 'morsitans']